VIYHVLGQEVLGNLEAVATSFKGMRIICRDIRVSSGMYFLRMKAGQLSAE